MHLTRHAVLTIGLLVAACGASEEHGGNPNGLRDNRTPFQKAEAEAEEKAYERTSKEFAEQVEKGELSWDDAACQMRGGDWDDNRELCKRELMRDATERKRNATQAQVLTDRVEALAGLTSDHDTAVRIGNDAAGSYLDDHPEDYRGAASRALHADRKAKILPPYDQRQMGQLNRILN